MTSGKLVCLTSAGSVVTSGVDGMISSCSSVLTVLFAVFVVFVVFVVLVSFVAGAGVFVCCCVSSGCSPFSFARRSFSCKK